HFHVAGDTSGARIDCVSTFRSKRIKPWEPCGKLSKIARNNVWRQARVFGVHLLSGSWIKDQQVRLLRDAIQGPQRAPCCRISIVLLKQETRKDNFLHPLVFPDVPIE